LHLHESHKKLPFLERTKDKQEWVPYIDPDYKARFIEANKLGRPSDEEDESVLAKGKTLLSLAPGTHALNCSELTCIAVYVAHRELGEPDTPHVGKASLSSPADHSFCVVASPDNLRKIEGKTVEDLKTKFTSSDDIWVADPWLNVHCQIASYPDMAHAKLAKWQGDNKRILWTEPNQKQGWHPPLGAYDEYFKKATIGLPVIDV
jgi:hypothetical protein